MEQSNKIYNWEKHQHLLKQNKTIKIKKKNANHGI